ncbi:MAG: hypothetical protein ACFFCX_15690 [Candidatus Sifarchaeia archaeon]
MSKNTDNTYRIILQVSPGVKIEEEIEVISPKMACRIGNAPTSRDADLIQIAIEITEKTLDAAEEKAKSFSDGFVEYMSFLSRTGLPRPDVIKGYEITDNKKTGEFIQYYYDWKFPLSSPRTVRDADVAKVFQAMKEYPDESMHSAKRAISWYRDGLDSSLNIDKFLSFFTALESLNGFLREHYNLEVEFPKCSKCGHKRDFPTLNGVRTHIRTVYSDKNYWKPISRLRNEISHGEVAFASLVEDTIEMLPIIETCLMKALDKFFGIENQEHLQGISFTEETPVVGRIITKISGPNLSLLKEDEPDVSVDLIDLEKLEAIAKIPQDFDMELTLVSVKKAEFVTEFDFKGLRWKLNHSN